MINKTICSKLLIPCINHIINGDDSTLQEYILCYFMFGMLGYACLSLFFAAAAANSFICGFNDVVKLSQVSLNAG